MSVDPGKLRIVTYPARVLRTRSQPVAAISDEVRSVASRMIELMHEAPGVGLAAPQVGLSWRMFVAVGPGETREERQDFVFINPVLSNPSRETEDFEEGCLSLPQIHATIRRPKAITVTAQDLMGNTFTLTSEELQARIWQHETDHLDGLLILDRMSPMDKLANQRVVRELEARSKQ
ncbi:MAG: peptide deformylase [Phycisphaeraceae bacterium]|nr:peptide deformylase [Phycisphaeraceae bacterium]